MTVIVGPTLPEPYYSDVESVWDDLVDEFGIDRYPNPYPHFTLYGLTEAAETAAVEAAVEAAAAGHSPVTLRTDGIGVFPGNHVFLPVALSRDLAALHRDVVEAVDHLGDAPTPFYEPDRWFPHVGLAFGVDDDLAGDIVTFLLEYEFDWEFTVDSVAITRPPAEGSEHDLVASVDL